MLLNLTVMIAGSLWTQSSPAGSTPRVGGGRGMIIICSRHNTLQSLLSLQTALTLLQTFMAVNQIKLWLVLINIISCNIWFMCVKVFYQYWTKSVCLMWWWRFMPGGQVCVTQAKSNYCLFIWREWFSNCFYGSKQWVSWLLQELHLWSLAQPTHNWTGGIFWAFCIIHQFCDCPQRWCLFQFNQMKCPWFCQKWMWSCLLPGENIAPWREFVVSSLWPNSSVPSPGRAEREIGGRRGLL